MNFKRRATLLKSHDARQRLRKPLLHRIWPSTARMIRIPDISSVKQAQFMQQLGWDSEDLTLSWVPSESLMHEAKQLRRVGCGKYAGATHSTSVSYLNPTTID